MEVFGGYFTQCNFEIRKMFQKYFQLGIMFFLFISNCIGQQLVPNPSFEKNKGCPDGANGNTLTTVIDWYQPTLGSTDYFNICEKGACGVPENCGGRRFAKSGVAYIGFILYDSQTQNYREYFSTKLLSSLVRGKKYWVRINVCPAHHSEFAISDIALLFSSEKVVDMKTRKLLKYEPQLRNSTDSIVANAKEWTEISWLYTADGSEQYMTIGNFTPDRKCHVLNRASFIGREGELNAKVSLPTCALSRGYYYLDDVSILELKDSTEYKLLVDKKDSIKGFFSPNTFMLNKSIALKNVLFASGKSQLLSESFVELDKLVLLLKEESIKDVEINGYTDNVGDEKDNLKLSKDRAEAVQKYLVEHGIDNGRVKSKGYGSAIPIADNSTEEGKKQNRRVEFVLKQN
jgi:OOP family OmpA-OmpF porin